MQDIWLPIIAPELRRAPFLVVRYEPDMGLVIVRIGNRDVQIQYGDARHSLYIEASMATETGSDNTALRIALTFVASLPAGRPAATFGCPDEEGGASDG
eukprot:9024139-Pyramimonas_sp.AAC.1